MFADSPLGLRGTAFRDVWGVTDELNDRHFV